MCVFVHIYNTYRLGCRKTSQKNKRQDLSRQKRRGEGRTEEGGCVWWFRTVTSSPVLLEREFMLRKAEPQVGKQLCGRNGSRANWDWMSAAHQIAHALSVDSASWISRGNCLPGEQGSSCWCPSEPLALGPLKRGSQSASGRLGFQLGSSTYLYILVDKLINSLNLRSVQWWHISMKVAPLKCEG